MPGQRKFNFTRKFSSMKTKTNKLKSSSVTNSMTIAQGWEKPLRKAVGHSLQQSIPEIQRNYKNGSKTKIVIIIPKWPMQTRHTIINHWFSAMGTSTSNFSWGIATSKISLPQPTSTKSTQWARPNEQGQTNLSKKLEVDGYCYTETNPGLRHHERLTLKGRKLKHWRWTNFYLMALPWIII